MRELEESLLRSRALLVVSSARPTNPASQVKSPLQQTLVPQVQSSKDKKGRRPRYDEQSRNSDVVSKPGRPAYPEAKSVEDARIKLTELSKSLEKSIMAKRKDMV